MSYESNPEVIGRVRSMGDNGNNEDDLGDHVVGIQAYTREGDDSYPNGCIELEIRKLFEGDECCLVRMDAEQFMQAVGRALLNRDS